MRLNSQLKMVGTAGLLVSLTGASPLWSKAASRAQNFEYPHVAGQMIVTFKPEMQAVAQKSDLVANYGGKIMRAFASSNAVLVKVDATTKAELTSLAAAVANDENVAFVEANTILSINKLPNDPKLTELYGMHNEGQASGTADADIDAPEAWDIHTGSRDVVVAVIDTGINYAHPDLAENYWTNPGESGTDASGTDKKSNGIDDDQNGFIDDWRGWDFVSGDNDPMDDNGYMHGSHCAGSIGAKGNDGKGIVGVNWDVSLVGLKFLDAAGTGTLDAAVQAIEYATKLNVDIMSNSWGGGGYSEVMANAITAGAAKDILFVAAAGNNTADTDWQAHYPSAYPHDIIVAVAATDRNDKIAGFSNYGLEAVDLAAPGVDIVSAAKGAEYKTLSGTSMATPHVAGAAALIKAAYPDLSALDIKKRLLSSVDPVAAVAGLIKTGGRLNVAAALENDRLAPGMVDSIEFTGNGLTSIAITWPSAGDDGEEGTARQYEMKISSKPITTDADWNAAQTPRAKQMYDAARNQWSASISGLPLNAEGYLSIRAIDNVGNVGPLSQPVEYAAARAHVLVEHRADTMNGLTAEGTWNLETPQGRESPAYSDSPAAPTANSANHSLIFPAMRVATNLVTLGIAEQHDLEVGFDIGYVEVKVAGSEQWQTLRRYTGTNVWRTDLISLKEVLGDAREFTVRLRIETDSTINQNGWFVDDVMLIEGTP